MSDPSQPQRQVGADERLLSLVHALVDPGLRLTRRHIRAHVPGYGGSTDQAFERMFERDKEALRQWGISLSTSGDVHDPVYRIDSAAWDAQDVVLSPLELAVVGLAAQAWNVGAQKHASSDIAASARLATTKLAARGTSVAEPVPGDLSIRLRAPGPAYLPLIEAIEARRPVTFTYLSAASGTEARRRVEPWEVLETGTAWYLVGLDTDRGRPRAFRLSRIRGAVTAEGEPGQVAVPTLDEAARHALVRPLSTAVSATVALLPERAHELRRRALSTSPSGRGEGPLADREIVTLPEEDLDLLADEIAALADAALVLSPPSLREAVLERLRAVAALHPVPEEDAR